jgi:hypothetical protein
MANKTNKTMVTKLKKEKPLKTWGDVDRYMKSLGYVYVNQLKTIK